MKRISATTLAFVVLLCSTVAAGQPAPGVARGQVTDSSAGVLPGVTVVATAADGRILKSTVTDPSGVFVLRALPAGVVTLTFQLEGFATSTVALTLEADTESRIVQRLELAQLSETVVVHGPPAPPPPPRVAPPLPPPPPPPEAKPVPVHDRDSICGPAKPGASQESRGTIRSGLSETQGALYAAGSQLVIDAGLRDGLVVGTNLVVRRDYIARWAMTPDTIGEHTAGLLQIVKTGERASVAVVVYACDEFRRGDFLAAFKPEPIRDPDPVGAPSYRDAAHILFADEGQTLGAPRRLMVIDKGTDEGLHAGQRVTLFRPKRGTSTPNVVGDAVVVAVRHDSATIRIVRTNDAIEAGDWAAPQTSTFSAR